MEKGGFLWSVLVIIVASIVAEVVSPFLVDKIKSAIKTDG